MAGHRRGRRGRFPRREGGFLRAPRRQRPGGAALAQSGRAQALKQVLERTFAADGPFAEHVPGFRLRAGQLEMSEAIGEAIENTAVLVAEAGTGTGKTFAYLVPALLAGGKVIVSTGTKTLQDQLFHRDLPKVRAALGVAVDTALLKGRANYVCLHHLEGASLQGSFGS